MNSSHQDGKLGVSYLRCEYLVNPLGIDERRPRLSWIIESNRRGAKQIAYRIQVASTPEMLARNEADLWDSGRVRSDASTEIVYRGRGLASRQRAWWRVERTIFKCSMPGKLTSS